jgi:hypothetical protein
MIFDSSTFIFNLLVSTILLSNMKKRKGVATSSSYTSTSFSSSSSSPSSSSSSSSSTSAFIDPVHPDPEPDPDLVPVPISVSVPSKDAVRLRDKRARQPSHVTAEDQKIDRERKRKTTAWANVGKVCYDNGLVTSSIIKSVSSDTREKLKDFFQQRNSRKATIDVFEGRKRRQSIVGLCDGCKSTCDKFGCKSNCKCLEQQTFCKHSASTYICNAMPDKIITKRVEVVHEPFLVKAKKTPSFGLMLLESVKMNDIIIEYTGSILKDPADSMVSSNTLSSSSTSSTNASANNCFIALSNGTFIDGFFGNESKFINSSCKNNCMLSEWKFPDENRKQKRANRVYVTATQDISARTLLHSSYKASSKSNKEDNSNRNADKTPRAICCCHLTKKCQQGNVQLFL